MPSDGEWNRGVRAMNEAVLVALITGGLSLIGVIISNVVTAKKSEAAIRTTQAVMDARLDELTREVREHNDFARRMPVLEERINGINTRIDALEHLGKYG